MITIGSRRLPLREEHKTLTHNRVLDAAVTVLGEKAFVDATMEDVARAAGVTRVTVYAHVPGKSEILRALESRLYAVTDELYAGLAATAPWDRVVVRTWLERATERGRQMAPTIRVLTATVPTGVTAAARERYLTAHRRYVELLVGDPQRWHAVAAADAEQRVLMALLQIESFLSIWITRHWPLHGEDPLDLLTETVCRLLAPALHQHPLE